MAMSVRFTTQTFLGLKSDERQMFLNHLIIKLNVQDLCFVFEKLNRRIEASGSIKSEDVSTEALEGEDENFTVNVDPLIENGFVEALVTLMAAKRQNFLKSLIFKMEIEDVDLILQKVIKQIEETDNGIHVHNFALIDVKEEPEDEDMKPGTTEDVIIKVDPSLVEFGENNMEEGEGNSLGNRLSKMHKNNPSRISRCGKCKGCKREDCKTCEYCKDMNKYGGEGKKRQACVDRTCDLISEILTKQFCENDKSDMKKEEDEGKSNKEERVRDNIEEVVGRNSDKLTEEFYSYSNLDPKDLTCEKCAKTFLSRHRLTEHMKYHIKLNLMCEHCSKICPTRQQLKYHLKTHLELAPHKCEYCGRGFINKNNLTKHIRTHTKEKPYKCDECDKSFPQVVGLNIHKNIHQGKRPFACEHCDKAFFDKSALTKHRRTHTGEKPYPCKKCNKSFATSTHLKTHMKSLKCSGDNT